MGGFGSGGKREGAGRKKRTPEERIVTGVATSADRQFVLHPPETIPVRRPIDLTGTASAWWDELAPLATTERTLTPATTIAFRHLCEAIAMRDEIAKTIALEGLTIDTPLGLKAHPLLTPYRGLMQRVEAGLMRFRLLPIGKPLVEPTKPQRDDFDEFERAVTDDDEDD